MASSAAESVEGGASAPPSPLANPVDALVAELFDAKRLKIRTKEATYTLTLHHHYDDIASVSLQYRLVNKGVRSREWHAHCEPDHRSFHILIAALVSEDSYRSDRGERDPVMGRKLWSMCCGTSIWTSKRLESPPS